MAKPRVFISSTYYDLKQTREDVAIFLNSIGYEPIRNEQGQIPYGNADELQDYCYKEISNADILIAIIGGRFGSDSNKGKWSVSNQELLTAITEKKQVYIFIDKNVYYEYFTYKKNKEVQGINYFSVDNPQIFQFIDQLHGLAENNNIKSFETSAEVIAYLKEQFAGLFQRLLEEQNVQKNINLTKSLNDSVEQVNRLVDLLIDANKGKNQLISDIRNQYNPLVRKIFSILELNFPGWFENIEELNSLMELKRYSAKSSINGYYCWEKRMYNPSKDVNVILGIEIKCTCFDSNGILSISQQTNVDEMVRQTRNEAPVPFPEDLPF